MLSEKEVATRLRDTIIKKSNNDIQTSEVIEEVDNNKSGYSIIHVNIPIQGYPDCGMTLHVVDGQISIMSYPVSKNIGNKKYDFLDLCNVVNESRDHYTLFYSSRDDSIRIKTSFFYSLNTDAYGNKIFMNNDFLDLQVYETIISIGRVWCTIIDNS